MGRAVVIERNVVRAPRPDPGPRHLAIVMDGCESWARARALEPIDGYRAGADALRAAIAACAARDVAYLTATASSPAAWDAVLERLCAETSRNVQIRTIGDLRTLPETTRSAWDALCARSSAGARTTVVLAPAYDARRELTEAMRSIARDVAGGRRTIESIDEETIASRLATAGTPDPDLVIGTGGDLRIPGSLLYQIAYAELWATPAPWPDFDADALEQAFGEFARRQRRFGT